MPSQISFETAQALKPKLKAEHIQKYRAVEKRARESAVVFDDEWKFDPVAPKVNVKKLKTAYDGILAKIGCVVNLDEWKLQNEEQVKLLQAQFEEEKKNIEQEGVLKLKVEKEKKEKEIEEMKQANQQKITSLVQKVSRLESGSSQQQLAITVPSGGGSMDDELEKALQEHADGNEAVKMFLETNGIDSFEKLAKLAEIVGKDNKDWPAVRTAFSANCITTPGIVEITKLKILWDHASLLNDSPAEFSSQTKKLKPPTSKNFEWLSTEDVTQMYKKAEKKGYKKLKRLEPSLATLSICNHWKLLRQFPGMKLSWLLQEEAQALADLKESRKAAPADPRLQTEKQEPKFMKVTELLEKVEIFGRCLALLYNCDTDVLLKHEEAIRSVSRRFPSRNEFLVTAEALVRSAIAKEFATNGGKVADAVNEVYARDGKAKEIYDEWVINVEMENAEQKPTTTNFQKQSLSSLNNNNSYVNQQQNNSYGNPQQNTIETALKAKINTWGKCLSFNHGHCPHDPYSKGSCRFKHTCAYTDCSLGWGCKGLKKSHQKIYDQAVKEGALKKDYNGKGTGKAGNSKGKGSGWY